MDTKKKTNKSKKEWTIGVTKECVMPSSPKANDEVNNDIMCCVINKQRARHRECLRQGTRRLNLNRVIC